MTAIARILGDFTVADVRDPSLRLSFHPAMNDGDSRHSNGEHEYKEEYFYQEHEAKGVVNKLVPLVNACPREIHACQNQSDHAGNPENALSRCL